MKKHPMKKLPYDRCDRMGELILQVLTQVFYNQIEDKRLKGLQFTAIQVTRDLQIAKVYYFISGNDAIRKDCLLALNAHLGEFRYALSQELTTKFMPSIRFYFDDSIEHGERINSLLAGLHDQKHES